MPELINDEWIGDLAFLMDFAAYFNEMNLKLLGENQLVNQLYNHVKTFQAKHFLWGTHLTSFNTFHSSILSNYVTHDYSSLLELCSLNNNFSERFQEFNSQETRLCPFSAPSVIEADIVPEMFQIVLLEFQSNLKATTSSNAPNIDIFVKSTQAQLLGQNSHKSSVLQFWKSLPGMTSHSLWSMLKRKFLCLVSPTNESVISERA